MKLTLNKHEEKKGILFKKIEYCLDVTIDFDPKEIELIKKHKWQDNIMCEYNLKGYDYKLDHKTSSFMKGKPVQIRLDRIEELNSCYNQIIENSKILKNNLEYVNQPISNGPEEIEL